MHIIISLAAFQIVRVKSVKTCKISAVDLDSVPVRSAVAESCGSVFWVKIVPVKTGYCFRKKNLEAGWWCETWIQVSVSSELSKRQIHYWFMPLFGECFLFWQREESLVGRVFFSWKTRNGKIVALGISCIWALFGTLGTTEGASYLSQFLRVKYSLAPRTCSPKQRSVLKIQSFMSGLKLKWEVMLPFISVDHITDFS